MEKVKVVHWQKILGDDADMIINIIRHNDEVRKYGKSSRKIPDGAIEEFKKKMWICQREGWYNPKVVGDKLTFMHLIPGNDFVGDKLSNSVIDMRGKRREYIQRRDTIHTEYQEALEREYYSDDFPAESDVHSIVEGLTKTMEVKA
jgi:hypothetical protein